MEKLIRASRKSVVWDVPWFVAQATYHSEKDPADDEFRAAQKALWVKGLALEGPDTDALGKDYRAGVHFNGKGLQAHGRLWAAKVGTYLDQLKEKPAEDPKKIEPERLKLWNMHAPLGDGTFEMAETWITIHRPEKPNGTAIVICPGGGYGGLVTGAEGHGIASWFNAHGITGIVLEYRLPKGRSYVPLLDAQRAIRTVRANAKLWGIDPAKVGIIGFSAGGHLASTAGTHFDDGDPKSDNPVEKQSCRPDFMILVYPVISMGEKGHGGSRTNLLGKKPDDKLVKLFSNETQVTAKTPPAFLAHAKDDRVVVPENSKAFYDALQSQKVPAKYLELASGGHGLNGYKGPMWEAWQSQSLAWLVESKFIPAMEEEKSA